MNTSVEVDLDQASVSLSGNKNIPSQKDLLLWQSVFATSVRETAMLNGMSESSVRSAVKRVEKLMASEVAMDAASLKLRLHLELETVKSEAMKAWKRSIGVSQTRKTKTRRNEITEILEESGVSDAEQVESEVTEKDEVGDPRFLSAVQKAIEGQMSLWPGVQAPRATSLTGPDGTGNPTLEIDFTKMSDSQLEEYFRLYQSNPGILEMKE